MDVAALEALGYTVTQSGELFLVVGYGISTVVDAAGLDLLGDPAAHAERKRQFETGDPLKPAERALADAAATNAKLIRDRLIAGITAADTHIANIEGASTPAQQKAAMLFALKGLKQLARLEVQQLTSAD